MIQRLSFWWRYLLSRAPWDTGITPPEIVALVEHERLPPGRAIDLGCGTGTNVIYLAQHGWEALGVDYVAQPLLLAQHKAHRAGVEDRATFVFGDITRLAEIPIGGPFDMAMDIGCGHSLPLGALPRYAHDVAAIVRPGGTFMVYMFRRTPRRSIGLEPAEVEALFQPNFRLRWLDCGQDLAAEAGSAWYRFERVAS
jgi:cyclopropane fatty-acyl-phospholipid synthase-like methyltransferase